MEPLFEAFFVFTKRYISFLIIRKMKRIWIIIPIILFGLFLFLARYSKYKDFHNANIDGRIDTIYRYRDYVMIDIDKVEFRIIPVPLYNEEQLDMIAKIGDTVKKAANSDNFILLHEGDEAFEYTVKKW